jgi:uncharacterized phage protein (TIGR02218 family)
MRQVPARIATTLRNGAATLATCWRLVRTDGVEVLATGHDRPLTVGGRRYSPASALDPGMASSGADLSAARTSVSGALRIDSISDAEIASGLWDRALVELRIVDWQDPSASIHLWSARVNRITRKGQAFEMDLEGPEADLERTPLRVFSRQCDAVLGDGRCGVDVSGLPWRHVATLLAVTGPRSVNVSAVGLEPARLKGGRLTVGSGPLSGLDWPLQSAVPVAGGLGLELAAPMTVPPQAGVTVHLTAGCDHAFATCRDVFANALNFRGCPLMPGDDAVFAGPAESGNDGGRR